MPLPQNGIAWPPTQFHPMLAKFAEHDNWYQNNIDGLTAQYTGGGHTSSDGVIKRAAKTAVRYFWGERRIDLTKPPERKLHVPVASDLAQASADLLFSEPPTLTVEAPTLTAVDDTDEPRDTVTQDRLDTICDEGFHQTLASAAETAAALGGVYLRAMWDTSVYPDRPFTTKVDYDAAIPEFRFGVLTAVTFWTVVEDRDQRVWRHLERHETDPAGVGVIVHGLYEGSKDNLGRRIPFAEHEATRWLAEEPTVGQLINGDTISTLTPGLDVFHMPNVAPNRNWRHHPIGKNLGRSDFDGIEPVLDALDEAYTSLIRDVRLGKAMLVVPQGMLSNNGPGKGAGFEQNEIYSGVNAAPGSVSDAKLAIEQVQFDIRIEEHERTIAMLWNTIIRSAGYSAQTFGEGGDVAITATEVFAKERRSGMSRNRKIRGAKPAVTGLAEKLLAIDATVFNSGADASLPVTVAFADGVQDDPEALARTAQLLAVALAASIETRVRLVNKDRDEDWITAEVERIKAENNLPALADPATLGENGLGLFGGGDDGDAGEEQT